VTEPATLEPIDYISVEPGNWRAGYVIPDHERERWDAAPLRPGARAITEEARDIAVVVAELEPIVYLDAKLEAKLRRVHELEPLRVSRLTTATLEGVTSGRLTNPAGLLWKRLAELERGTTTSP
jgi:hypothetical protein